MNAYPSYGTLPLHSSRPSSRSTRSLAARVLLGLSALVLILTLGVIGYSSLDRAYVLDGADDDIIISPSDGNHTGVDIPHLVSVLPPRIRRLMNPASDPCIDFHEFACGNWEDEHANIPADETGETYAFDGDRDDTLHNLLALFNGEGPGKVEVPQQVLDYYNACSNMAQVEQLNLTQIQPLLDQTEALTDMASVAALLALIHQYDVAAFFTWVVLPDHSQPSRMQLYLQRGGIGLPSHKFYSYPEPPHMDAYLDMIMELTSLATVDDPVATAHDVWAIETDLAAGFDAKDKNGHIPVMVFGNRSELAVDYPHFDWESYFEAWGASDIGMTGNQIVLTQSAWMGVFDATLAKYDISAIKRYLRTKILHHLSPLLPDRFLDALLDYETDLTGRTALFPRWKKCIYATRTGLPFLVSENYIANYIPEPTKRVAKVLLEDIRIAFEQELQATSWMSNETRVAAIDKLKRMRTEVAYPDDWSEYLETSVVITDSTYFQNYVNCMVFRNRKEWGKLRIPVQRGYWRHLPIVTNAYYSSGVNAAFLPVGMLQDPFYNLSLPAAYNFGSLGSVMGHELTHGFDNTGHLFDAVGKRRTWWDKETLSQYNKRAHCFRDLYSSYTLDGTHVNGDLTLGEDLADVGGLKTAYNAFLLAAEIYSPRPPSIRDRQLFWLSYASTRCGVERKQHQLMTMQTEQHPPRQFRLIGPVSQLEDFARDFQCPLGSPMNPEKKCELW